MRGLVVDLFAGGGGASLGIERALGRPVDIAINHSPKAIECHRRNHPATEHLTANVWEVDPLVATRGRPVDLLHASPDCRHFSRAKGSKPVSKRVRSLAWVVTRWAKAVRPRQITLENVPEFQTWGPLRDGIPIKERAGETFRRWIGQLRRLGYAVEWRTLNAADFGAPTTRKRLFLVARCDGRPIIWPTPTHTDSKKEPTLFTLGRRPWRAAAECVDWSDLGRSIFDRKKPHARATCRRLARGVVQQVLRAGNPFIIPVVHAGDTRVHAIDEPLRTICSTDREFALASPLVAANMANNLPRAVDEPTPTVTGGGRNMLATPLVARLLGSDDSHISRSCASPDDPVRTVIRSTSSCVRSASASRSATLPRRWRWSR